MNCGTLAWAKSDVASPPRNHHLTVIAQTAAGPFLYAIGGTNGLTNMGNVDRAPIHDDGSIGDFTSLGSIPRATGGMTGAIVNGVIVFAGGNRGTVTDAAYSAVINADGSLGPWKDAGSTLHFRMHPGSVVQGDTMFVLGGFNDPNVWDDIVSAKVAPDGTVSAWAPAGKLPGPLSHFSATLHDGYVYLAGGLDTSAFASPAPLAAAWRGHLLADGTIGEWTKMPDLPASVSTHASYFYGGYVYVGGGLTSARYRISDAVWRAPIGPDHGLGPWETVAKLPINRAHVHQMPTFGTHVYSVAGAITLDLKSTTEVDVGVIE